jgi:hypothetical protein
VVQITDPISGGEGVSLVQSGSIAAAPGQGRKWELLRFLWGHSTLPLLRQCFRSAWGPLSVWSNGSTAWFRGYCQCHSVWACPVCSPLIRQGRAIVLGDDLVRHLGAGGGLCFVTLTTRHGVSHSLESTFSAVADGWRDVTSHWSVKEFRRRHPFEFVRVIECTYGCANGWHPHLHLVVASAESWRVSVRSEFRRVVFRAWASSMERAGLGRPVASRGVHVVWGDAGSADYVMKVHRSSQELLRLDTKTKKAGRHSTEPPFALLARAASGDDRALSLWRDWEQATKGRKMMTYSRGWRGLIDAAPEVTDSDAMELANSGGLDAWEVGTLAGRTGVLVARHPRGFEIVLTGAADGSAEGLAAAVSLLWGTAPYEVLSGIEKLFTGQFLPDELVPDVMPDSEQCSLLPGDDGGSF